MLVAKPMVTMKLSKLVLPLLTSVAMLVSTPVSADTVNFMGSGKGLGVVIHSPSLGDISVKAGELNWARTSGTELPALFYSYCVDANHYLVSPQTFTVRSSDDLDTPGVTDAGGKAAWLVNTYAEQIHATGSNLDAAGLQIAIWTALYNENGSFTSGPFKLLTTGEVATRAQFFLTTLFSGPTGFQTSTAKWLDTPTGQDQMIPVPEPGSMLLLGTGLAAGWRAVRKRRSA